MKTISQLIEALSAALAREISAPGLIRINVDSDGEDALLALGGRWHRIVTAYRGGPAEHSSWVELEFRAGEVDVQIITRSVVRPATAEESRHLESNGCEVGTRYVSPGR